MSKKDILLIQNSINKIKSEREKLSKKFPHMDYHFDYKTGLLDGLSIALKIISKK